MVIPRSPAAVLEGDHRLCPVIGALGAHHLGNLEAVVSARRPMKKANNNRYCSFCGKLQNEVARLIAGPTHFICNECVDLCHDIVHPLPPRELPVFDTGPVDDLSEEIRRLALALDSKTHALRHELLRQREIIGFGRPE
jgi:hypothetical protein